MNDDETTDELTEYPRHDGLTNAEIIQNLETGDRVHVQFPLRDGDVNWHSFWVKNAGDDFAEFDTFRAEVDPDGLNGFRVYERVGEEWLDDDVFGPSVSTVERIPADVFDTTTVIDWEIRVSETEMGGVSTDQTVFPEAETRAEAEAKAKRWASMNSGYTPTVYRGDEVVRA